MASFTTDAELMTNYVAAMAVPGGSHFAAVVDENYQPMVVSLSNDETPKLQIIRQDPQGVQYLFDLGSCLALPDSASIQAFEVYQAGNGTVYLAVAWQSSSTASHIVLCQPFAPQSLQEGVKLGTVPGDLQVGTTKKIFMSPNGTAQSNMAYPVVFIAHDNVSQSKSWGQDITQILVAPDLTGWSTSNALSTPVNVAGIVDIAPANSYQGQGMFVLYRNSKGESKIYGQFIRPDPQSNGTLLHFTTDVQCPQNATCLSTFQDTDNFSALLIGAPNGISYLTSSQAVRKASVSLVSNDAKIRSCKSLIVAQDDVDLSFWFTSSSGQLGYIRTDIFSIDNFKNVPLTPVLLLPAGKASSIAPCVSRGVGVSGDITWQKLFTNDKFGNLTLLEQASDLDLWREKPFFSNDQATNFAVQSYSMTIKALDTNGSPVANASVNLATASSVTGILNGSAVTLTSEGDWYLADREGTLNFIVPTLSIAAQAVKVMDLRDANGKPIAVEQVTFDPAQRAMTKLGQKLASIRSADDLAKAKTQSGNPLFDPNDMPSEDDLKTGFDSIHQLYEAYNSLPSDGSTVPASNAIAPSASAVDGIMDVVWDTWEWVKQSVRDATGWFVTTSGGVWKFVCHIAGESFEYVLDCIEKVGEAMTWVWNKIKVGIKSIIDFIGFIFDWNDIVRTKDTVSSLITASVDLAANKVGSAAASVDRVFNALLDKIDGIDVKNDVNVSAKSGTDSNSGLTFNDLQHSTSLNWTSERMKNGGLGSSSAVAYQNAPQADAQKTWDEIFAPALTSIKDAFTKVGDDINDLFYKQGSITSSEFMNLCKDVLKAGVTTIQKVVVALIQAFQKLLQLVSEYGNKYISIPVFSALYKDIAQHDLTAFDAIALLIAIPMTIFTKLITGSAPPQIPGLDAALLDGLLFGNNAASITPQMKLDFNTLTTGITVSASLIGAVVKLIRFIFNLATEGSSSAMKLFTGSAFLEFFSVLLDMFGALNALPTDPSLPGLEYRQWISWISFIRGGSHILASFVPTISNDKQERKDRILLVLDLATTLTNYALYQAVGSAEIEAANTWPDYNEASTIAGMSGSVLNAVAGIGYFVAFMFKEEIEVSAVGLVVLEGATVGLNIVEGVKWHIEYNRGKATLLPAA